MAHVPEEQPLPELRNRRDCDEAVDAVAQKAAGEIEKAWTEQQSGAEALVRIEEILAEATGHDAVDGGPAPKDWVEAAQGGQRQEPTGQTPFEGAKGDPAEGKR